jgi:hypothetical protein
VTAAEQPQFFFREQRISISSAIEMDAGADAARMEAVSRANACWRQISEQADSLQQSEIGQERTINDSVVTEMLRAGSEGRTEEAADILEQGFEQWDRQDRSRRLQEYADGVRLEWEAAVDVDWTAWQPEVEDLEWYWGRVVEVTNLEKSVSKEMVEATFFQVGEVLGVAMGDCCAEVEFRYTADAEDAVKGFHGVELAGVEMGCKVLGETFSRVECEEEEEELRSDY